MSPQMDFDNPYLKYNYTQYSHDNDINVIPEESFKHLVTDTFKTITDTLRSTYGPYGSSVIISEQNETITTKDGYNVFEAMGFSHQYKKMVYLAIYKICKRVNETVGDGTTSCILLAEKIFNNINTAIKTPDDKRNILAVLSYIEKELQNVEKINADMRSNVIQPLTEDSFTNIIRLASNYDEALSINLMKAMSPVFNEDGTLSSMRNVVPTVEVSDSVGADVDYSYKYLPGKYRVGCVVDIKATRMLMNETNIKIALFDHPFQEYDWDLLIKNHVDDERLLVLAPGYNGTFYDNKYKKYVWVRDNTKKPIDIILGEITGIVRKNEVADLAAILNIKPFTMNTKEILSEDLKSFDVLLHNGNCLCIMDCESPTEYIELLKGEMNKDLSKSYTKHAEYEDRISALSLNHNDTDLTVKTSSTLEAKIIKDKIADCSCIISSAAEHGIVPNMLHYAHYRIDTMKQSEENTNLMNTVLNGIGNAIEGLFEDIWFSKYGVDDEEHDTSEIRNKRIKEFYQQTHLLSYNIINDEFVDSFVLPTSPKYDLEVVVAAISIVKYLLTSRAFIFDSFLLKPHGDKGVIDPSMV